MALVCDKTELPGVVLFKPDVHGDPRGFFIETWSRRKYTQFVDMPEMVQDNFSHSSRGVLRGLHYQWPNPQDKLVYVIHGEIYDVAVDIRKGSPTFGAWTAHVLSGENHHQLYVPAGFAHGFCVLSEQVDVAYKCSAYYAPDSEKGIAWNDPDLAIPWPVNDPVLSRRDGLHKCLKDTPADALPPFNIRQ